MTVVLDAPLVSTMAEPTADASGFVFDASSGLYYHASSGFYYDAKAGWYYNTQDGQYYVYENDQYVPLATTTSDETALGAVGDEVNQSLIQSADGAPNHEEDIREEATIVEKTLSPSGAPGVSADQDVVIHETPSQIVEDSSKMAVANSEWQLTADAANSEWQHTRDAANSEWQPTTNVANSEWHPATDAANSEWQHTTDAANSEWQHTTDAANSEWQHTTDAANSEWQHTTDAANSEWQHTTDAANSDWQPTADVANYEWQDASSGHMQSVTETPPGLYPGAEMSSLSMETVSEKKPDETVAGEPEETRPASVWIAETLTELYGQSAYEGSTQPAYANPSTQQPYYEEEPVPMGTYMTWQEAQEHYRRQWGNAVAWNGHATRDNDLYESDDQSEELEEGEWRPDEDEKEIYVFADVDEVEEGEILEDPNDEPGNSDGENDGEDRPSPTNGEDHLNGVEASVDTTGNELGLSTSIDMTEEEEWQAQYLQTTTSKARSYRGSMDLWDWSIIEQEKKLGKKKVKKIFRLIGRLAPNATQVHPSLRGSGGLIRTTPVREADHEFVKVSSGRIYKLRRPSSKHSIAYPSFVSSNPTQDWGFPLILGDAEDEDVDTSTDPSSATVHSSTGQRNKQLPSKKKHARLKLKGVDDEPQPKYRDRAAERRTLHKGFGIGPGQKVVNIQELEKEEADAATEMPGALEKAASARPIGRDNIGKRMLEGMGWKEGQSLGPGDGGLVDPILALGNTGRTGLGYG